MKTITLFKRIDDIQLGHLYEHIYCAHLADYFRENGLFAYLDYHLDGKTYYHGAVVMTLNLYTKEALSHEKALETLKISFDDEVIAAGLLQIFAEKYADVDTYDIDKTISELTKLHQTAWQTVTPKSNQDLKVSHFPLPSFTLRARSERQFGIIQQSVTVSSAYIHENRSQRLPLFIILSKAIRSSLQEDIANTSFCYSYEDQFITTNDSYKDINKYRIDKRENRKLSSEINTVNQLLDAMKAHDFSRRFASTLQSLTANSALAHPSGDEIMDKSGIIIGYKSWQSIATQPNIDEMLSQIKIEFKYGTERQQVSS